MCIIGLIYILNPGFGFGELRPEKLTVGGKVEEGGARRVRW
jgi:hypothetical protein